MTRKYLIWRPPEHGMCIAVSILPIILKNDKHYHDYGIGVEGTILLGLDNQSEDDIKRLIDFLLEIDLDLAEFTDLPHSRILKCMTI